MIDRPRLLDLFCGAGGAARGYQNAGFYVVGIDIKPMPRYCGDEFHQADALEYLAKHGAEFDAIHASPPCRRCSISSSHWPDMGYRPHLLPETETRLLKTGRPFVVENIDHAPFMLPSVLLCGIQFRLHVIRHRRFSSNILLLTVPHIYEHPKRGDFATCAGHEGNGSNKYSVWADAMGIDWMTKDELSEAIPPAYTEFIGRQLMKVLA